MPAWRPIGRKVAGERRRSLTSRSACATTLLTGRSATEGAALPATLYEREDILDACLGVFALHGYDNTSTAMLAKAAGISKALVFHHFKSKKELYLRILDSCLERGAVEMGFDHLSNHQDFFEAREKFSLVKAAYFRDNPDLHKVVREAFFATPDEVRAEIEEKYGTLIANKDREWERLFEKVPLRKGVDRRQAFKLVMLALDYCDNQYLSQLTEDCQLDEERLRSFLAERNRFLCMIRYGIEGRGGACDDQPG